MKRFFKTGFVLTGALFLLSCSSEVIQAQRGGIIPTQAELQREDVADYMTYLRLKKEAGPLDQDYILLSYRVIQDMLQSDLFQNKPERVKIALRDVLNYHPTAQIRPAIIHEAVEHELMNSEALWVTDGSVVYDYVLDVELSEVPVNDEQAEGKALSVLLVLSDVYGQQVGEWFGFLKREKGSNAWF